jgi:hypothetical protein
MAVTKTVVTSVVTRAWNEFEPKVLTFFAFGLTSAILIQWGSYVGWHPTPALAAVIVTVVSSLAGYLKSSTSKVAVDPAPVVAAPVENSASPTM